ncbi:kinesin-like protein KIN-14T isoform X1 [Nicotiana tabacum]|uniref:Kinesin-like protein KIF2C isoform X1 n=2 Tax=Nicotiana TaxID=4085 RepID=A0A1S3YAD6_TOBAC|nr:PREDICTED: kinesin-like protein KIF2C [Nicotiana sylvestris]XP_016449221.1 PREDICTED: kinesin-like protein KIF2C isoform X1 [Nicotiana tabacum]
MKSMEHSERSFDSLSESIHSLMGMKTHLTCNWVDSVRGIIKTLQPQPSDCVEDDQEEEEERKAEKQEVLVGGNRTCENSSNNDDPNATISKIKDELAVLDACIKKLNIQRRQVLNELLDLKGNIRVFCRIRPISIATKQPVAALGSNEVLINLADHKSKIYSFDKVFHPSSSQGEVFSEIEPIIKSALDGYNACIFAYGQTGTGKTFTMEGTEELPGVVPRAIEALFKHAADSNHAFLFSFSMLEIYMGYLKDLLIPHSQTTKSMFPLPPCLSIQTHPNGEIEIENLVTIQVNDFNQAMRLYKLGCGFRSTASTNSNRTSSRSHCMIRISVSSLSASERRRLTNKLWMIDLGGSERVLKTKALGRRFEEGKAINLSLSSLGDVIHALQSKRRHIPYRNSKLTQVLKDSLGDDSKTLMLVHVSPQDEDLCETLCTLNFATRVKRIQLRNEESSEVKEEKELAINNLLQKMKQIENNRNDVTQQIKKLNEKLGKLIVISASSTELADLSDVCIEGLGSNMRFLKDRVTANHLADFPRFMRPTVCSRSKSGNAGVEIQALKSRALLPPRKGKRSSHCAKSVAFPIEGTSECYSESSISRISCLVGPNTKFSADNETEFSHDTSDSDIKVAVFTKQDLPERDSKHKKFNLRPSRENHANTTERVSTQNHSKVDNWLQLHKYASNTNRCTHKNKRILAIPIPEKKARARGRVAQDLHDEQVPGKGLRKRIVNHQDAKSADMENHMDLSSELEAEANESHAISKHFMNYEKSYPAPPACNIDEITMNGTQGQVFDSTTEVSECSNFSAPDNFNDLKLTMPDIAYQERYNMSASTVNSLSIGLIESPSSSKKKPNYEQILKMEEESNFEKMHVSGCFTGGIKPCHYGLRSPSALSICKANQIDYYLDPKLLNNTRTRGFVNLLKPKVQILFSSILVALGFASLGLGHDFFYALAL